MLDRKKEMAAYIENFKDMPDRLLKYNEILLEGENALPYCYQDTMSYRRLAVALTTRCSLSCKWCLRLDPLYKKILNKDLNFELYRKFVRNTKGKFRMVHLAGLGEPTLYPKLIEIVKLSKNLSKDIKITTNGALLTPDDIDRYLKAGLTHIEISIDAFDKEKLKEYRGIDLDHLSDIVHYISDGTPLHLQINSVISSQNHPYLIGMIRLFENVKNIKIWHTIPLFETAQTRRKKIKPLKVNEYQNVLLGLEKEIEKNGLSWKLSPPSHGVQLDPVIEMKRRRNICFSCFEDPYIGVKGQLIFCPRQEHSCGSDISVGFEKAWNHPVLLNFRKNMLKGFYPDCCGKICFLKDRSCKK